MKVLELRFDGDPERRVNLHPNLTVVRGLDPEQRQLLVDSLAGLPHGSANGLSGLIEAQGVLFDLTSAALGLLDLDSDVNAVVRGADLPGHDREARASVEQLRQLEEVRDRETARLARAREAVGVVVQARQRLVATIDEHHRSEADTADAIVHAATALARARQDRRRAQAETTRLRAELDEVRAGRPELAGGHGAATAGPAEARLRCERAIEATAQAAAAVERAEADTTVDDGAGAEQSRTSAEGLEARAEWLRQQLIVLGTATEDVERVRAARGRLDQPEPVTASPAHERALALAERWRAAGRELDALDQDTEAAPEPAAVSAARGELDEARRALQEARGAPVGSRELRTDEVAALEAAHTAVLDAQERTEGRFGAAKAQRRLEEARSAERAVLDRLGFSTYADYMMSASNRYTGPEEQAARLQAAQRLTAAEAAFASAWREAHGEDPGPGPLGEGAGRDELHRQRDDLRREAAVLLDHPLGEDVAADLDALAASASGPTGSADRELIGALSAVGIAVDDQVDRDALVVLADAWLAEQELSIGRQGELNAELEQVEADLARGAGRHGSLPAPARVPAQETPEPLAERQALLEVRRAEEAEAAAALRRAEQAEAEGGTGRESEPEADVGGDEAVARAEAALREAEAVEVASDGEVAALEAAAVGGDRTESASRLADLENQLQAVTEEHQRAVTEVAAATTDLEAAERAVQAEAEAGSERRDADCVPTDRSSLIEDIDWYLLSRLASQRTVSVAGSVPLVLDDPFADLHPDEGTWLLSRLERMTQAVQVILVSDRPEPAAWVAEIGEERGSVVQADAA